MTLLGIQQIKMADSMRKKIENYLSPNLTSPMMNWILIDLSTGCEKCFWRPFSNRNILFNFWTLLFFLSYWWNDLLSTNLNQIEIVSFKSDWYIKIISISAKNHSSEWDNVFQKQQETFMSVKAFGRTFLTNYRDLDKRVPGTFEKLTPGSVNFKFKTS